MNETYTGVILAGAGIIGLTAAGALLAPVVLPMAGFTSAGIAAGSIAASIQGPAVAAGSYFALAQSTGALGAGACAIVGAKVGLAAGVSGAATGIAGTVGINAIESFVNMTLPYIWT